MVSASVIAEALAEIATARDFNSISVALGSHTRQDAALHRPDATYTAQVQRQGKFQRRLRVQEGHTCAFNCLSFVYIAVTCQSVSPLKALRTNRPT